VSRNITERKDLEEQLLQAQKLEAVGRLAGGVAHDYNNMIGVILGYAKLIEDRLNPLDPLRRNVQAIASAAERSANLTRQLLAFARKQVIAPVPVNLNESISLVQKMLTRLIGEDITLSFNASADLWTVKIDPTQVDQILANLATNARDAIDDVGTITIETANVNIDQSFVNERPEFAPGDYVVLSFSDSGAHFRTVLHDKARWAGYGPWAGNCIWDCETEQRFHPCVQ
jgi:signal transduction histidine kinase